MKLKRVEVEHFKGRESVVLDGCGAINALVGKNNSGKSSILHAVDMAGLALSINNWSRFQPKLEIKDMFGDVGEFAVRLTYADDNEVVVTANRQCGPSFNPAPSEEQKYKKSRGRERHGKRQSKTLSGVKRKDERK